MSLYGYETRIMKTHEKDLISISLVIKRLSNLFVIVEPLISMMNVRSMLGYILSDNYQIIDAFDNPVCAVISRIDYVQRKEPRFSRYDPG